MLLVQLLRRIHSFVLECAWRIPKTESCLGLVLSAGDVSGSPLLSARSSSMGIIKPSYGWGSSSPGRDVAGAASSEDSQLRFGMGLKNTQNWVVSWVGLFTWRCQFQLGQKCDLLRWIRSLVSEFDRRTFLGLVFPTGGVSAS